MRLEPSCPTRIDAMSGVMAAFSPETPDVADILIDSATSACWDLYLIKKTGSHQRTPGKDD
jgi:hypothetical protein